MVSSTPVVAVPGGNDDFRVTCGTAGVPEGGKLNVTLKGGDGSDNLQCLAQGELHRALNLVLDGGDDVDTVSADIALDAGSTGDVNATVLGGNGDDTLALHISNPSTATVQGLVDGGAGFDRVSKTSNVAATNCELFLYALPVNILL